MVPAHVVARQPEFPRAPPCLPRQGHRRVVIARLAHHVGPATSHRGHLLLDLRRRHSESNQRVASHGIHRVERVGAPGSPKSCRQTRTDGCQRLLLQPHRGRLPAMHTIAHDHLGEICRLVPLDDPEP